MSSDTKGGDAIGAQTCSGRMQPVAGGRAGDGPAPDQHRVEIEFEHYGPHITLLHPESGCTPDESGGECYLTNWIENEGPELLRGKLTVPVVVEEAPDRDHPLFHLQEEANDG